MENSCLFELTITLIFQYLLLVSSVDVETSNSIEAIVIAGTEERSKLLPPEITILQE